MNLNDIAMQALNDGRYGEAQTALENNLKQHLTHQSLHNLGVLYFEEGIRLHNGKVKDGRKRGLKMLKKAGHLGQSYENYAAIGEVAFALGNYKEAACSFTRALAWKDSCICLFNLGITWMRQKNYQEAADCFSRILDSQQIEISRHDILIPYAFCVLHFQKEQAVRILCDLVAEKEVGDLLDIFVLAYCCKEWSSAIALCDELISTWSVDVNCMAMVVDCVIRMNNMRKAKQYLNEQILLLKDSAYNRQRTILQMKLLLFSLYRKCRIRRYKVRFPTIMDQYFLTEDTPR